MSEIALASPKPNKSQFISQKEKFAKLSDEPFKLTMEIVQCNYDWNLTHLEN